MTDPCPCGSQRKSGTEYVTYLDEAALDAIVPSLEVDQWAPLLSWLIGTPIDTEVLCLNPPESVPEITENWFTNPLGYLIELLTLVNAVRWPLLCECIDCGPATDCGDGATYIVGSGSGYFEAGSCYAYKYHISDADVFLQAGGFACDGPFTGDVFIQWNPPQSQLIPNPHYPPGDPEIGGCGGVSVWTVELTGSGAGQHAVHATGSGPVSVTVTVNGAVGPPTYPWPELPVTVGPFLPGPSCDPEDTCISLDYITRSVTELLWQSSVLAAEQERTGATVDAINGPYSVTLPGITDPITGTLSSVLPRLFAAIAPVTPEQLSIEWTEVVTGQGALDLDGAAVVSLSLTDVPPSLGYYDREAPVYYANARTPAPANVTLRGDNGVVQRLSVVESTGTAIVVNPLATELTYDCAAGVELTVTGSSRSV